MDPTISAIYVEKIALRITQAQSTKMLLNHVSLGIGTGQFVAVVGASGCGKSTLIKSLAGIQSVSSGKILLGGHPVDELKANYPLAIGYLPQFGSFHEELTVMEILDHAVALRLPKWVKGSKKTEWKQHIISLARLEPFIEQKYKTLSGGQTRRVALAEELVGDPPFLFLDELTSGLDPYSDQEMMIWLNDLAHQHQKTILLVTHSVANLHYCDSILFMHRGHLVFHGTYAHLLETHGCDSIEAVFQLYQVGDKSMETVFETFYDDELKTFHYPPVAQKLQTAKTPNGFTQFQTLFSRQMLMLWRDRGQLWMQLILLFTFPGLVAVFATKGLPQVRSLSLEIETNIVKTLQENLFYLKESFHAASLISGLTMFQVILLMLMGANNGAREIAKERGVLNKELRAGLSPWAYVATKFFIVLAFSFFQAFWMSWFVKSVCGFPGSFAEQFLSLFAPTLAMSVTCLGISAFAPSPERASLLSIYLVGLQLPLSGAVLSLPEWLSWSTRPFIAAYWGWSGYLKSLESFRLYDIVKQSTHTIITELPWCLGVLGMHVILGLILALYWIRRKEGTGM